MIDEQPGVVHGEALPDPRPQLVEAGEHNLLQGIGLDLVAVLIRAHDLDSQGPQGGLELPQLSQVPGHEGDPQVYLPLPSISFIFLMTSSARSKCWR